MPIKRFQTKKCDKSEYRKVCEALQNNNLYLDGKYEVDKLDRFQLGILIDKNPWKIKDIKDPPFDLIGCAIRKSPLLISSFGNIADEVLQMFVVTADPKLVCYLSNPCKEVPSITFIMNIQH